MRLPDSVSGQLLRERARLSRGRQTPRGEASGMRANPLILLLPPARFERAAPGLGILCSIHLSYGGSWTFKMA